MVNERTDPTTATPERAAPEEEANELIGSTLTPRQPPDTTDERPPVTHEQIAVAAYYRAAQRNFEPGFDLEDWLEAERELVATMTTLARGIR